MYQIRITEAPIDSQVEELMQRAILLRFPYVRTFLPEGMADIASRKGGTQKMHNIHALFTERMRARSTLYEKIARQLGLPLNEVPDMIKALVLSLYDSHFKELFVEAELDDDATMMSVETFGAQSFLAGYETGGEDHPELLSDFIDRLAPSVVPSTDRNKRGQQFIFVSAFFTAAAEEGIALRKQSSLTR